MALKGSVSAAGLLDATESRDSVVVLQICGQHGAAADDLDGLGLFFALGLGRHVSQLHRGVLISAHHDVVGLPLDLQLVAGGGVAVDLVLAQARLEQLIGRPLEELLQGDGEQLPVLLRRNSQVSSQRELGFRPFDVVAQLSKLAGRDTDERLRAEQPADQAVIDDELVLAVEPLVEEQLTDLAVVSEERAHDLVATEFRRSHDTLTVEGREREGVRRARQLHQLVGLGGLKQRADAVLDEGVRVGALALGSCFGEAVDDLGHRFVGEAVGNQRVVLHQAVGQAAVIAADVLGLVVERLTVLIDQRRERGIVDEAVERTGLVGVVLAADVQLGHVAAQHGDDHPSAQQLDTIRLAEEVVQTRVGQQPAVADGDAVVEQRVEHGANPQSAGIESEQVIEDRTKGESLFIHRCIPSIAPIG